MCAVRMPPAIRTIFHLILIFVDNFFLSFSQIILLLKSLNLFHICTKFHALLQITSHVIAYCSSCINPVLYAFLSENFRKAFKKVSRLPIIFFLAYIVEYLFEVMLARYT